MAYDNQPGEVSLRANTLVIDAAALAAQLPVRTHGDPQIPEALVLEEPLDVHGSALWRAGAFLAQSRGAMLVARSLAPRAGERVLDLCAAPGGKSTHLAALMQGQGEIVAVERNRSRAGALARTAQRLHAGNIRVEIGDAARWPAADRREAGAGFDRVLVDPPCTGLGTLRGRPDLRWRATPESAAELARLQAEILAAGANALKPGGTLVYSTCTIDPPENEDLVAAFLAARPDFHAEDLQIDHPLWKHPTVPLHLLPLPHRNGTDGFFVARLRRDP
jgi:16S rRNA (cytosine967-C5)-methyltransferase